MIDAGKPYKSHDAGARLFAVLGLLALLWAVAIVGVADLV